MKEFFIGSVVVAAYIIAAILVTLIAQRLLGLSGEPLRKALHFIFLGAYIPMVLAFGRWWQAAIFAGILIALVFPFLAIVKRVPILSPLIIERWRGEFSLSMLMALFMMLISIALCWGIFDDRCLVLACIYAWGVGDGFAALVGKRFGRHKIKWRFADPDKSAEGVAVMLILSFVSPLAVLLIRGGLSLSACLIISALSAVACTAAELCAKRGYDTVICHAVAMAVILPLVGLFGI